MLRLRFKIMLENLQYEKRDRPRGPIFNRWLPDGRQDSIQIPTGNTKNKIEIWFERLGYVEGNFIEYDWNRREIDPTIMDQQGKLEAGDMRGEAIYSHISKDEILAVCENRTGSQEYIAIGKRVVHFLSVPLKRFMDILRVQYGQYWLPELEPWDSRSKSLGRYCSSLGLEWLGNDGHTWSPFRPTENVETIYPEPLPGRGYGEYLTKADWSRLKDSFDPQSELSLALVVLGRAQELFDSGHIKESFAQGVTALEMAVNDCIRTNFLADKEFKSPLNQFMQLSLGARTTILTSIKNTLSKEALNEVLLAVDVRNKIVHEGKNPNQKEKKLLLPLLRGVALICGLTEFKTPTLTSSNQLSPPEKQGKQIVTFGKMELTVNEEKLE